MDKKPLCLLVDNSDSMLSLLTMFMEHLGFEPITARDGNEALDVVKEKSPQLVISEIHMPNRDGLSLLQDLRQLNPELPVILITGYMSYKVDLEALKKNNIKPDAFLEKPFTLEQLKETVTKLQEKIEKAWPE